MSRLLTPILFTVFIALSLRPVSANDLAPTGTLHTEYLASNPAQAVQDHAGRLMGAVGAGLAADIGYGDIPTPVRRLISMPGRGETAFFSASAQAT